MQSTLDLQEQTIVLAIEAQSPAIVNLEFLVYSGVIPREWELVRDPIYTPQVVQLVFQSGISITAQSGRILIVETIANKPETDHQAPQVARRLVQSLPNLQYHAIGFNPLGHVKLGDDADAIRQYFNQTLLAPGPWQEVGNQPVKSRISFSYTLDATQLNVTVSEAGLRNEDETVTPVVLFSGNFNYPLVRSPQTECIEQLCQYLDRVAADRAMFRTIVDEKFLGTVTAQPALLPIFA